MKMKVSISFEFETPEGITKIVQEEEVISQTERLLVQHGMRGFLCLSVAYHQTIQKEYVRVGKNSQTDITCARSFVR